MVYYYSKVILSNAPNVSSPISWCRLQELRAKQGMHIQVLILWTAFKSSSLPDSLYWKHTNMWKQTALCPFHAEFKFLFTYGSTSGSYYYRRCNHAIQWHLAYSLGLVKCDFLFKLSIQLHCAVLHIRMMMRVTNTKPFWEGTPSCSRPHDPTGQQTPAAHSHRTAHWGLSRWQHET